MSQIDPSLSPSPSASAAAATKASASVFAAEPDRLIRLDEVKRRVGLGKSMIYELIREDKFPAPHKISPFAARWSDREISAWIDAVKDGFEGKKRRV